MKLKTVGISLMRSLQSKKAKVKNNLLQDEFIKTITDK